MKNLKTTTVNSHGKSDLVLYIIIWIDFLLQLAAIVNSHGHTSGMTFFDTIFLIVVKTENDGILKWLSTKVYRIEVKY
jgi:hypothetical protein